MPVSVCARAVEMSAPSVIVAVAASCRELHVCRCRVSEGPSWGKGLCCQGTPEHTGMNLHGGGGGGSAGKVKDMGYGQQ